MPDTKEKETQPVAVAVPPVTTVRVLHDFVTTVNGQVVSYKKDQLIQDQHLCRILIESKSPVVPATHKVDFHVCPRCHEQFTY